MPKNRKKRESSLRKENLWAKFKNKNKESINQNKKTTIPSSLLFI